VCPWSGTRQSVFKIIFYLQFFYHSICFNISCFQKFFITLPCTKIKHTANQYFTVYQKKAHGKVCLCRVPKNLHGNHVLYLYCVCPIKSTRQTTGHTVNSRIPVVIFISISVSISTSIHIFLKRVRFPSKNLVWFGPSHIIYRWTLVHPVCESDQFPPSTTRSRRSLQINAWAPIRIWYLYQLYS